MENYIEYIQIIGLIIIIVFLTIPIIKLIKFDDDAIYLEMIKDYKKISQSINNCTSLKELESMITSVQSFNIKYSLNPTFNFYCEVLTMLYFSKAKELLNSDKKNRS